MRYLLQFVIFSQFSTMFGLVQISFMKGVPRLNNSTYCDYYFACHAEGEILQWIVNDSNISNYSGQSTLGSVLSHSISNCNTTTTLLTLMALPLGMSVFNSVLIISCQSSTSLNVSCTDGSTLSEPGNPEKSPTTMAESNGTSVNLEHVLNGNLINADTSSCTNVFLCGVDNDLMTWNAKGRTFTFSFHDLVGMKRQKLQGSVVEQQAILIDTKPYRLVVALFIIDSSSVSVTCGYNGNTAGLSSMSCPTNLGTTEPEAMDTTESKTTGSMISESSTVGESSTMASGGSNPLILGLSIPLVLVVAGLIAVIIMGVLSYLRHQKKRFSPDSTDGPSLDDITPIPNTYVSNIPKPRRKNVDYTVFREKINFVLSIVSNNVFEAAQIYVTAPDKETEPNCMVKLDDNDHIFIGKIGHTPVGLIRHETGRSCIQIVNDAIIEWFPNAIYLISVGLCYAFDSKQVLLGDVFVSKKIIVYSEKLQKAEEGEEERRRVDEKIVKMENNISSIFCDNKDKVNKLRIAKSGRQARIFVGNIASGPKVRHSDRLKSIASCYENILGIERVAGYLLDLQTKGILINEECKKIQVIAIKAVFGFVNESGNKDWKFKAGQAAIHYIVEIINSSVESLES